jgi:hypothetical protein
VVDDSELTPQSDTLLFLDEYRPILKREETDLWEIPIRHLGGKQTTTPANWHEIVVVAMIFRKMRVEHEETIIPIASRIDGLRPKEYDD